MGALAVRDTESNEGVTDNMPILRGILRGETAVQWVVPEWLTEPIELSATSGEVSGPQAYAQAVANVLNIQRLRHQSFLAMDQSQTRGQAGLPLGTDELGSRLQPLWFHRRWAREATLSLQPLQEWEGYVTAVGPEMFTARLADVTAQQPTEEETADFPISDLSEDNLALLREGAVFRWVIGYQRTPGGTKRRVSDITFRRLPSWTKRELEHAQSEASKLVNDILWE